MDPSNFEPIESAPRDGTPVLLRCEQHPEFGVHLMGWSGKNHRWEGWAFALLRRMPVWWDDAQPQPTHWTWPQDDRGR